MEDIQVRVARWWSCDIPNDEFPQAFVKNALIYLYGEKCQGEKEDGSRCEWARANPVTEKVPLELDHINGDSTDSRPRNVRLLCPSCHALTPTYKSLNRGRGRGVRRRQQQTVNFLISEVARRTGRMPLIANEGFVLVHESVPSQDVVEPPAFCATRNQRFRVHE